MRFARSQIIHMAFMLIGLLFIARLFSIQVLSDAYRIAAEKNIIQPVVEHPYRGVIYDRHGNFLAYNVPVYDLMVIPQKVKNLDKQAFCRDFGINTQAFERTLKRAQAYSYVKPSLFIKNISQEMWGKIQDHMVEYLGFFVKVRTVRRYPIATLANTLGYVGEISRQQLIADTNRAYRPGDTIGISGLEKQYEKVLKGKRGIRYYVSDAQGITKGSFRKGALDQASVPGKSLQTTIDTRLQQYGEQLMNHKPGSIVAIAPKTGEVLALVSSPAYDPNLLTDKQRSDRFASLEKDQLAPLFHRPIMATYPPGSIWKLSQALIALQEQVISPHTYYACDRSKLKCHTHPSPVDLHRAIRYSCNPYFHLVFRRIINQNVVKTPHEDTRIGLTKWCSYLEKMGWGTVLGIDLPGEKSGRVPDVQFYDKLYGEGQWKTSTIRSLDIGQGELLVTPLQMANFVALVANRGYYCTPHLVKQVGAQSISPPEVSKHTVAIDEDHFTQIVDAMQAVVEGGTAWRTYVPGLTICAKTGTVENPHGEDHSVCVAFAPKENPQIALAVYIENAGWGSRAAATVAGLLIEQYLTGALSRPWLQDYVLKGDFSH